MNSKKILVSALFIALAFIFIVTAGMQASVTIRNEYITVSVFPDSGRFVIRTVEGNVAVPGDNDSLLLYPGDTSKTTINIDGKTCIFGDKTGVFVEKPTATSPDTIVAAWRTGDITVTQTLRLVNNKQTDNADLVAIEYSVKNEGAQNRLIGIRVLLDTLLGKNDGATFKIPQNDNLTKETEFLDSEIPQFWYCFDSFIAPTTFSMGIFRQDGLRRPDRVIFGSWMGMYNTDWFYVIDKNKSFTGDSAVALYYENDMLEPGKSTTYATQYGVFGAKFDLKDALNLLVNIPADGTSAPFLVSCNFMNRTGADLNGVTFTIQLPDGFALDELYKNPLSPKNPQKLTYAGNIKNNATGKISWLVGYDMKTSVKGGPFPVTVTASYQKNGKSYDAKETGTVAIVGRPDNIPPYVTALIPDLKVYPIAAFRGKKFDITGVVAENLALDYVTLNGQQLKLTDATPSALEQLKKLALQKKVQMNQLLMLQSDTGNTVSEEDLLAALNENAFNMLVFNKITALADWVRKLFTATVTIPADEKQYPQYTVKIEAADLKGNVTTYIILFK